MIAIDNPNKLPKNKTFVECRTLEEAERICQPDHEIYRLYHSALKYYTYFVEQEASE